MTLEMHELSFLKTSKTSSSMVFPPELSGVTTHLPNSPYHSQPAAWGCSPVRMLRAAWWTAGGSRQDGGHSSTYGVRARHRGLKELAQGHKAGNP